MKYLIETYCEGAQTRTNAAATLAAARAIARRQLSHHDVSQGRKMRRQDRIIYHGPENSERYSGYAPLESWVAEGPGGDGNETDYVTIFQQNKA